MPKREGEAQNKLDKEPWLVGETGPKNRSGKKIAGVKRRC